MSTTADLSPLARKIYEAIGQEGICGPSLIETARTYPVTPEGDHLTEFEQDIRDWGVMIGVAYGIARADDPFESRESVLERAQEAAQAAYCAFGDGKILTPVAFATDRAERLAAFVAA